jgi:hypothetical protein
LRTNSGFVAPAAPGPDFSDGMWQNIRKSLTPSGLFFQPYGQPEPV